MARTTGKRRKHGVFPVDAPAQGKRRGCIPARKRRPLRKRKAAQVQNPRLKDMAAPVQCHRKKVCFQQRQASNTYSYLEIRSHCSKLSHCIGQAPNTLVSYGCCCGTDIRLQGGEDHDAGHILFQRRPQDDNLGGSGKLASEKVVARLSKDAIAAIQQLCTDGLEYELRPVLEPFKVAAPLFVQMKPLNKDRFQLDTESDDFVFATACKKKVAGQTCQGKVLGTLLRWRGKLCFNSLGTGGTTRQSNFKAARWQCTELPDTQALASCFLTNILMRNSLPNQLS